jgi:hypothetical protein
MPKRLNSMTLRLPTCNFCGDQWLPQSDVVASRSYCDGCRKERLAIAAKLLDAQPIGLLEGFGPYILPRRNRAT